MEIPAEGVAEGEWIRKWQGEIQKVLNDIEAARVALAKAADRLVGVDKPYRKHWTAKLDAYERQISERLAKIGIESPKQLRREVNNRRTKVRQINTKTKPRLAKVNEEIKRLEIGRQNLRTQLRKLNERITTARRNKAEELTKSLDDRIIVSVQEAGDRSQLLNELREISVEIASQQHKIQNREPQLQSIVDNVTPLELAEALRNSGHLSHGGEETTLVELCGVTTNTQNVLCGIANDILLLNRLETVDAPDVPKIKVRREGEENN